MKPTMRIVSNVMGRPLFAPRHLLLMLVLAVPSLAGCSRKLTKEECDHLLGRGIALQAQKDIPEAVLKESGIFGVPLDVELVRKTARGQAKQAIEDFDRACLGVEVDSSVVLCGRRAKNEAELRACGGMALRGLEAGEKAKGAVTRHFSADECSRYAEHGVKIGAVAPDDVSKLMKECEGWLEIGFVACRNAAKDPAGWKACDLP